MANWFQTALTAVTTTLSTLTPQQQRQFAGALTQSGTAVTQAVESEEMMLIGEIANDPANAAAPLATLTGISGIPANAVEAVEDAVAAFKSGDKVTFNTEMSSAKQVILAQKLGGSMGGLGALFG